MQNGTGSNTDSVFIVSHDGTVERFPRVLFTLATRHLGSPFSTDLVGVFLLMFPNGFGGLMRRLENPRDEGRRHAASLRSSSSTGASFPSWHLDVWSSQDVSVLFLYRVGGGQTRGRAIDFGFSSILVDRGDGIGMRDAGNAAPHGELTGIFGQQIHLTPQFVLIHARSSRGGAASAATATATTSPSTAAATAGRASIVVVPATLSGWHPGAGVERALAASLAEPGVVVVAGEPVDVRPYNRSIGCCRDPPSPTGHRFDLRSRPLQESVP